MSKTIEEPQDLGVKIASEEGKFWEDLKKKAMDMIKQCEREILIQNHILSLIDEKLKEHSLED